MTKEDILREYSQLAAELGDIIYRSEYRVPQIKTRITHLNEEMSLLNIKHNEEMEKIKNDQRQSEPGSPPTNN